MRKRNIFPPSTRSLSSLLYSNSSLRSSIRRSGAPLPQKNITQVGFSYDGGGEFYLSLSYMKLYRKEKRQTPEFLFVSDGRLPVEVKGEMVNDGLEQIEEEGSSELFDEEEEGKSVRERKRERYWKWKGEEVRKHRVFLVKCDHLTPLLLTSSPVSPRVLESKILRSAFLRNSSPGLRGGEPVHPL